MSITTVEELKVPLYETHILSKDPQQLLDWARDLVQSLQIWADQITNITNQQLNASNADAIYFGTLDENGEWKIGTWRYIKIADDDFQLQKKIDVDEWEKNVGYKHDN